LAATITEEKIQVGLGTLEFGQYVSGVFVAYRNVGAIKATASFAWTREGIEFETGRPLQIIKRDVIRERLQATFTLAEISVANLREALGLGTANLSSSVSPTFMTGNAQAPKGDLTDSITTVGVSDIFHGGGDCDYKHMAIRFTHIKSCGSGARQIVELFKADPVGTLTLPFSEAEYALFEVQFMALADTTRASGAQLFQFVDER
jgi:hypothetical protein